MEGYNMKCDVTVQGLDEMEEDLKRISALVSEADALIAKVKNTSIHASVTSTIEH